MHGDEVFGVATVVAILFIGLPWLVLHYVTKWKQAPRITDEDEKLLDEVYLLARRLEERLNTVERIVAADNPEFRTALGNHNAEQRNLQAPQTHYQIDRRN